MKLKVLILHQTLKRTDEVLADYRLYMTEPHIVHTLNEALARLDRNHYSLIVVEVAPPWKYAAEPVVVLRSTTTIPILALMRGRDAESFQKCLEVASDCVWEPFVADEIIARGLALVEQSVFDRVSTAAAPVKSFYSNGLLISFEFRQVHYLEYEIRLARKEYGILKLLAEHKNHVLSKEQIYTRVWHDDFIENVDGVVGYQIHNLRKRLAQYTDIEYIENVWGEGYRFCDGGFKRIQRCI
ncbi:MAG: winged-helix domain-containing protein [Ruminococcaceae bacterium]|nr:winged-helix domain-containing protein [Oscillospiraceae bacterium]